MFVAVISVAQQNQRCWSDTSPVKLVLCRSVLDDVIDIAILEATNGILSLCKDKNELEVSKTV